MLVHHFFTQYRNNVVGLFFSVYTMHHHHHRVRALHTVLLSPPVARAAAPITQPTRFLSIMPPTVRLTKANKAKMETPEESVSNTDGIPSPSDISKSHQDDPITAIARVLIETTDEHCRYAELEKILDIHYKEALGLSASTFAAMSRDDAQCESDRLDLLLNCAYIDEIRKLVAVPILYLLVAALASEDSTFFKKIHAALVKLGAVPGKYPPSVELNEAVSLYLGHSHDTLLFDTIGTDHPPCFRTTTLMILQESLEKSLNLMNLLPLRRSASWDRLENTRATLYNDVNFNLTL